MTESVVDSNRPAEHNQIAIVVVYNGPEKRLEVKLDELIQFVLLRAIKLFEVTNQPHRLSLYRKNGTKLEENQTVRASDLHEGSVVFLRPDTVKGG